MSSSAARPKPQESITYQVGDRGFPVSAIKLVAMKGAKPPNSITEKL